MRLLPDTVAGRTLLLLIGMTVVLVFGAAVLLHDERTERFDEQSRFQLLERIVNLVRLLDDADDAERQRIIDRLRQPGDEIELDDSSRVHSYGRHPAERFFTKKLRKALKREQIWVRLNFDEDEHHRKRRHRYGHEEHDGDDDDDEYHHDFSPREARERFHELDKIHMSIMLWDGEWLNISIDQFDGPPPLAGKTLQLLGLLLVLLLTSGLILARYMAKPMKELAGAADRFGLGQSNEPIDEYGPQEVRNTIRAFNRMQERLQRQLTDRSQMLAAVSHDLRTPITTLRLRAEYIEDEEMREKTLKTLAEMEAILNDTLSFARDEAADESTRSTDLAALIQSIVDDHADLGGAILYQGPDRLVVDCRPVALRRALNNVVGNALLYADKADVRLLAKEDGELLIQVDDNGPGIPEEELEAVFTPFRRLESSRNRDTGGTGLGLAVAKSVMLAHGGNIRVLNLPKGGLRCEMNLPRASR